MYGVGQTSYTNCQGPRQLWLTGPGTGVWAELAARLLWPCTEGLYKDQLELDTELVREDDEAASTEGPDEGGLLGLAGPEDWDIKTCPFRKKKRNILQGFLGFGKSLRNCFHEG